MGCCQSSDVLVPSRVDSEADDEFQENPMGRMSGELNRPKSIRKRKWTVGSKREGAAMPLSHGHQYHTHRPTPRRIHAFRPLATYLHHCVPSPAPLHPLPSSTSPRGLHKRIISTVSNKRTNQLRPTNAADNAADKPQHNPAPPPKSTQDGFREWSVDQMGAGVRPSHLAPDATCGLDEVHPNPARFLDLYRCGECGGVREEESLGRGRG